MSGGSVSTGSWQHLAATWDGSTLTLYVDGASVDSVAATGSITTDLGVPLIVGNLEAANRGFAGRIDEVRLSHGPVSAQQVAFEYANLATPSVVISVGGEQNGAVNPWTVAGTQTRSGSFAAAAPEITAAGVDAWITATGLDEPGAEFTSWWWMSTNTGVDFASGTRAGAAPTDQYETALTSASGWDLATEIGGTRTQQAAAAGTPSTGTWIKVIIKTHEGGNSSVIIDGTEVISSTAQGTGLLTGSVGLRAGLLPSGQTWFVDDARVRKLIGAEPTTSVGVLERQ